MVLLSGFTPFKEKVPPPKDMPKRTQDKNAGIVIPSFDASPYDIIEKSYDPLDAFMLYPEEGIFMSLSTSNFDFTPHKLTFHHKKLGFVIHHAYRVNIDFMDKKSHKNYRFFIFHHLKFQIPLQKRKLFPLLRGGLNFLIHKVGSG
jgi:hypothetical protein